MPNLYFRVMSSLMAIRDRLSPRRPVLEEAGVSPGQVLLDYGCGPGSYTILAAKMVGPSGHVHAVDIHPMAIERIERRARRAGLSNVSTIMTDRDTGLPDASVDIALLYDILHLLTEPAGILQEISRVLRPEGALSVSGHDLRRVEDLFEAANDGTFVLVVRGRSTLTYSLSNRV